MMDQILSTVMFDVQANLISKIISGDVALPSKSEMIKSYQTMKHLEANTADYDMSGLVDNQINMVRSWMDKCNYPYEIGFEIMKTNYLEWIKAKCENVLTFRDQTYVNIYTKIPSPKVSTRNMDLKV